MTTRKKTSPAQAKIDSSRAATGDTANDSAVTGGFDPNPLLFIVAVIVAAIVLGLVVN